MRCNLCGSEKWGDMNTRKNVRCMICGSLERIRAIGVIIDKMKILKDGMRILHFAPEKGLYDYICSQINWQQYDLFDLHPRGVGLDVKKFDLLTDLPSLCDKQYDLILHSHILEHIPCSFPYILYHLFRSLHDDGYHLACIPFVNGFYHENLGDITHEYAIQNFGQFDHVRKFGNQDIDRHIGRFIKIPNEYDLTQFASLEELEEYNIPTYARTGFTPNTILINKRTDYLLPL